MRINQQVVTRIGEGVFQGMFDLLEPGTEEVSETLALVRIDVTAETAPHLSDENCLTPRATGSGLWIFPESELGAASSEFILWLFVGLIVLFIVCDSWPW